MTGWSGGCQCGRIRYRAATRPSSPHLCFCRMCQKAVGNYFAALGGVAQKDFELTRGEPSWFHSSDVVRRGFCPACGTPMFYQEVGGDHVNILLGTLDDPWAVPPEWQSDVYGKPGWFGGLDTLPESIGDETSDEQAARYDRIARTNHQHPDHDTAVWPQEK